MYKILGYSYGKFITKDREPREIVFSKIYVSEEFKPSSNPDYYAVGDKALTFSCTDSQVLDDAVVGDFVELYFDSKQRVAKIVVV